MMCVYGPAGSGKTMSVNSALRHLAPDITHRLELRAGPTPRDIRHGLFQALGLPGPRCPPGPHPSYSGSYAANGRPHPRTPDPARDRRPRAN
ncbi:ATP-binding protein [Streptomyces sp. NPDC014983]|uniref:ATP-binding protein n=1 Tax=Streptomyces sp. NPDC014983 TaxID=3364933 RepID=UPI0036F5CAA1